MTKRDLQQIGQIMEEKLEIKLTEKLAITEERLDKKWEVRLKQTGERFDKKLDERLTQTEEKFDGKIKKPKYEIIGEFCQFFEDNIMPEFERLNGKISQLPTKGYLDEKINNAMSLQNLKLLKEDERVDRFVDVMHNKNLLTKKEVKHINKVKIFPKIPA